MLSGKINPLLVLPYWIAQLIGSFMGALLVRVSLNSNFFSIFKAVTQAKEYDQIFGGVTLLGDDKIWYQV